MKKVRINGNEQYAGYLLIFLQGIIIALIATFILNQQYISAWRSYPQNHENTTVYLKNTAEKNQQNVQNFLLSEAERQNLFISRMDLILDNNGSIDGYTFGFWGNPNGKISEFSFMGSDFLSSSDINKLLKSEYLNSTLGVETGSIDSIGDIPHFRFYEHIVIKKLPALLQDSGTINGTYVIQGLDNAAAKSAFLQGLSENSGLSEKDLLNASSGSATNRSVMGDILLAFLAAQVFLNIVFFLVLAMKSLPKQGRLVLLGWSRTAFAKKIFSGFMIFSIIAVPFLTFTHGLIAGWHKISAALIGCYLLTACIHVVLILIELLISATVIMITRPLDAIHGRIPKKTLYALGICAYFIMSAGLIFCSAYVDQPMASISENTRLSRRWNSVSEYQLLKHISVGQDEDSFSNNSNTLDKDLYDWYTSIADQNGVYLIQTSYYDEELLAVWRDNKTYASIPYAPLWLFTVSPNYLQDLGVDINSEALEAAHRGSRLYLIPAGLSKEAKEQIENWLRETDTKGLRDGDIQTTFTQNPAFQFLEYAPDQPFFTWTTADNIPMETKTPVIYVATPQNMKYTEIESLRASGFNGYIKFKDKKTAAAYTQPDVLSSYHLSDNTLNFTDIHNYIDGLQKEMGTVILWFGCIFLMLMFILIGLLLTLAAIFRMANQEKIHVKKFMGFSFLQIYKKPVLLLSAMILSELAAMVLMRSKFGLLLIMVMSIIQIVIFIKYMTHNELKNVLTAFKGE